MNHLHKSARPDLVFEKMDATNTVYEDDDFNVVLDKGMFTVWKFANFPTSQILREIKYWQCWSTRACYMTIFADSKLLLASLRAQMISNGLKWTHILVKIGSILGSTEL